MGVKFHVNTLFGTPSGTTELHYGWGDPVIPVTMDKLTDAQRTELEQMIDAYRALCLESYSATRNGVIKKADFPRVATPGERSNNQPTDEDIRRIEEIIGRQINQALVNHSRVFANSIVDVL